MGETELESKFSATNADNELEGIRQARESLEVIRSYYALTRDIAYEDYDWDAPDIEEC